MQPGDDEELLQLQWKGESGEGNGNSKMIAR